MCGERCSLRVEGVPSTVLFQQHDPFSKLKLTLKPGVYYLKKLDPVSRNSFIPLRPSFFRIPMFSIQKF